MLHLSVLLSLTTELCLKLNPSYLPVTPTPKLKKSIEKQLAEETQFFKLFEPSLKPPIKWVKALSKAISRDVIVDLVQIEGRREPGCALSAKTQARRRIDF